MRIKALTPMLIRPRETIRSVLTQSRPSITILLVLLATASGVIRDIRWQAYRNAPQLQAHLPNRWIMACIVVGIFVAGLLAFYVFSAMAWGIGRLLGGTADARAVRVAIAWSLAPIIWALLYRIPVALFQPALLTNPASFDDLITVLRSMAASMNMYVVASLVIVSLLNLAVLLWSAVIASVTLSEVNGFSTWRGAGTLVFSLLAPMIVIAAFLMSRSS